MQFMVHLVSRLEKLLSPPAQKETKINIIPYYRFISDKMFAMSEKSHTQSCKSLEKDVAIVCG